MTAKQHRADPSRVELALRVTFQSPDGLEQRGTISDLSAEGAFIDTRHSPREGATVALRIESPTSWDPISIAGVVLSRPARVTSRADQDRVGPGFGVRFVSLSKEHSDAIRALLEVSDFDER